MRRLQVLFVAALVIGANGFNVVDSALVHAQAPTSLTTSPVSLDLSVTPGQTTSTTLQVMNNTTTAIPIMMELKVFGPYGNSGEASITDIPANSPTANWVHFSPATFVAQPNTWMPVKMTISLPQHAQLGYYFAAVFKPVINSSANVGHVTNIRGSNAVLVLIDTHSGNESRKIQIANFSVNKHLFEYLPATFSVTIHNSGNIYLAPQGNIFISRNSSMVPTIDSLPINAAGGNVLPNSNRNFLSSWTNGFPIFKPKTIAGQPVTDAKGVPVSQLQWNFANANKLRFGKYYAQLTLIYNNGTHTVPVVGQLSFWVIPWKLLIVATLLIALLAVGMWTIGRSSIRNIRKVNLKR